MTMNCPAISITVTCYRIALTAIFPLSFQDTVAQLLTDITYTFSLTMN